MSGTDLKGAEIPPFYAGEIGRRATARAQRGGTVISMHFGQPSAGAPAPAIEAAHRVLDTDAQGYFESQPLKARLARHYREEYGVDVDPGRILLTAGASAALVAVFAALFDRGDRVAVLRPGYPAYRNTLLALGLEPVEIRCGPETAFQLTEPMLDAVEQPPAALLLASPANPTGAMLEPDRLEAIMRWCDRNGVRFISDEIYHGISYGTRAASALEFDNDALVINSFSKLYRMPGWRLGWMIVPERWAAPLSNYLINMFLTPPTIAQHAALAAMSDPEELMQWVGTYRDNRDALISGLAKLGFDGIRSPDGAFYVYADFSDVTNDSLQFCLRCVEETGVALAPGIDFDPENGRGFVRFSFAVKPQEVDEALSRLGAWLPAYRDS